MRHYRKPSFFRCLPKDVRIHEHFAFIWQRRLRVEIHWIRKLKIELGNPYTTPQFIRADPFHYGNTGEGKPKQARLFHKSIFYQTANRYLSDTVPGRKVFFATPNKELMNRNPSYRMKRSEEKMLILRHVFIYYNQKRVHTSTPNDLPPTVYRKLIT